MTATVRLGVIGTNFISDNLAEAVSLCEGVCISAVYSRRAETAKAFAKKHGIENTYTDMEAFLASDIDAVYVASPNALHGKQSLWALRAGKHVLCEKPLVASPAEFAALEQAALENKRVLLEAMRPAFDPAWDVIEKALPRLGRLRRVQLEFRQYSSRYDRFRQGEVLNAFDPSLANAALMDIGVYPLYMCLKLFGMPEEVQSSSVFLENGMEGEGTVLLSYGDMQAVIAYSKITASVYPSLFVGEDATLIVDKISTPLHAEILYRDGRRETVLDGGVKNNMVYELKELVRLIRSGETGHPHLTCSAMETELIAQIRRKSGIRFYEGEQL